MSTHRIDVCSSCGAERIGPGIGDVPGERVPCPNDGCGSVAITTQLTITADLGMRARLVAKAKDRSLGSRRGRKVDMTTGAEYYRLDDRWHRVERKIDYVNDWYDEVITVESTGEVIREVHEPLSDHQERGTAKRRPDSS